MKNESYKTQASAMKAKDRVFDRLVWN